MESIRTLTWIEHMHSHPKMYLGNSWDESEAVYSLFKFAMDYFITMWKPGNSPNIDVWIKDNTCSIQNKGNSVPFTSMRQHTSEMVPQGMKSSNMVRSPERPEKFRLLVINAYSEKMVITSYWKRHMKRIITSRGIVISDEKPIPTNASEGTSLFFAIDRLFSKYSDFKDEEKAKIIREYMDCYPELSITLNGRCVPPTTSA